MTLSRRKFIQLSSYTGTTAMFSSLAPFNLTTKPDFTMNPGFQLKILATNWGYQGSTDSFCEKAKKEGYDGLEIWWPTDDKPAQDELFTALKKHHLDVGFLCGSGKTDPQEHLDFFKRMIDAAAKQNIQRPLYINCHSGRDHFSFDTNKKFVEHTLQLSNDTGITICHETHRSRIMFAAHIARQYIEQYAALKLTFDVSHWCNVHESLLADQQGTLDMVLERVEHIHARIGHPESPQVNDPRAPEWDDAVKAHFGWWDKIIERKKRNGERMTILTEFGPPNYMPTLPYTQQPLGNQWDINVHMMKVLRERYR